MRITFVVLAMVAGLVACSSDDGALPSSEPASAVSSTATTTTSVSVAPTTTPATTTVAATTTEAPTTTAAPTTTTLPAATGADLAAALPNATELPAGWTLQGGPNLEPEPLVGPIHGLCGLRNMAARAQEVGSTGIVSGPDLTTSLRQNAYVALVAFPSPETADRFMVETANDASMCPGGVNTYEIAEGTGADQFDGFSDDPRVTWDMSENTSLGAAAAEGADQAIFISVRSDYSARRSGVLYGGAYTTISQYERHGAIVVVIGINGACCYFGYVNADADPDNSPTYADVDAFAGHVRAGIIDRLRAASFVA